MYCLNVCLITVKPQKNSIGLRLFFLRLLDGLLFKIGFSFEITFENVRNELLSSFQDKCWQVLKLTTMKQCTRLPQKLPPITK